MNEKWSNFGNIRSGKGVKCNEKVAIVPQAPG